MKYFIIGCTSLFAITCKHPIAQPVSIATTLEQEIAKRPQIKDFDYSIDTVKCDLSHFPSKLDDGSGQPRQAVPPQSRSSNIISVCLNRLNEDEVIFTEDLNNSYTNVIALNHLTKVRRDFINRTDTWDYDFSKTGWLLYTHAGQFWKAKDGGTPIPLVIGGNVAKWNHQGDKIIFNRDPNKYIGDNKFFIANENGRMIDSLSIEQAYYFDWSKNGDSLVWQRFWDGSIVICHAKKPIKARIIVPALGQSTGFSWLDDYKTMVVGTMDGLYIANTETQQYRRIRCTSFGNCWYLNPFYSAKHRRIFAHKLEILSPTAFHQLIVSMNLDGSDERRVDIP